MGHGMLTAVSQPSAKRATGPTRGESRRGESGRARSGGPSDAAAPGEPTLTLVTGTERYLTGRLATRTRDRLLANNPQAQLRSLDGRDPELAAGLVESLSPSLFATESVVVVTAVEEASEAAVALLAELLADPQGNRVVAVHSGAKSKKTLAQLADLRIPGGVQVAECRAPKRGWETEELLTQIAREHGRVLEPAAARAVAQAVGTDVALLAAAVDQLCADFPDDPITNSAVATVFSGTAEVTGFGFSDEVWAGAADRALVLLRWAEQTGTLALPGATSAAAAGLRSLVRVRSAPRGASEGDVARLAGVPSFKVKALRGQGRGWSDRELAAAAVELARTDAAVKGGLLPGESLDPVQKRHAMEDWVRETVLGREAGRAAARQAGRPQR